MTIARTSRSTPQPIISSKRAFKKRHDGRLLDEAALWPASTEKVLLSEAGTRPILHGMTVAASRGELAGDGDESWAAWQRRRCEQETVSQLPRRPRVPTALLCSKTKSNLLIATPLFYLFH